jgi:hypothetical protein
MANEEKRKKLESLQINPKPIEKFISFIIYPKQATYSN